MRPVVVLLAAVCGVLLLSPDVAQAASEPRRPGVAALQVALRQHGVYKAPIDGVQGPLTAAGLRSFRARHGLRKEMCVGPATRRALGKLGKPLLGQRELAVGASGWDVSSLEFQLLRFGLPRAQLDGRFTRATRAALRRFQRARGLDPDGIAGRATYRALAGKAACPEGRPRGPGGARRPGRRELLLDRSGLSREPDAPGPGKPARPLGSHRPRSAIATSRRSDRGRRNDACPGVSG